MEIYYVKEPSTRDPEPWESFIDEVKISRSVPYEKLDALLKGNVIMGLTYAQCPNIYWAFAKRTIAEESLPIRVFDRKQNSFRYESGGRHGIERVDEFHRIEPVYIGTPTQLQGIRNDLFERYKHVFDDILQIEWRTARVAPFYLQQAGKGGLDETEGGIEKGTIDFEAWLPFLGPRDQSDWLEFQNLSILGEQYTKAFNIKTQKSELWSGCTGIGLERWTVVFLAQKGLDPDNWSTSARGFFEGFPQSIRFL
jgi:seryl-tRNA synthetase